VQHDEGQPLPGRDLSPLLRGETPEGSLAEPLYFMTEDDVGRGLSHLGMVSGQTDEPVPYPSHVESVITALPTGAGDDAELWKLNPYDERLDEFDQAHGLPTNPLTPAGRGRLGAAQPDGGSRGAPEPGGGRRHGGCAAESAGRSGRAT
jgi:hypothetical protein